MLFKFKFVLVSAIFILGLFFSVYFSSVFRDYLLSSDNTYAQNTPPLTTLSERKLARGDINPDKLKVNSEIEKLDGVIEQENKNRPHGYQFPLEGRSLAGGHGRGIIYLKTPKAGSSTVTQVLHRIAWKHKLKIAREWHLGKITNLKFDLWVNHSPYTSLLFRLVPQKNHQFVSIIRDPGHRTKSFWTYRPQTESAFLRMARSCGCGNWADCGIKALQDSKVRKCLGKKSQDKINSQTLWQLGVGWRGKKNVGQVKEIDFQNLFRDIENGKHIMMVAERMEESLIVLRHAYNLSIDDVVFFSKKVHYKAQSSGAADNKKDLEAFQAWRTIHSIDMKLHNTANKKLDQWIQHIGREKVEKEVEELERLAQEYADECKNIGSLPKREKENCKCLTLDTEEWEAYFNNAGFFIK